jgi:hypothetical protein
VRRAAPLLALALAASACAGVPERTARRSPCADAWGHVTALLHEALETYLDGMRRFAAAHDGKSTAAAEARARARAVGWEDSRRGGFDAACRAFSPEELRCVEAAASAPELLPCGQEPLVTSFTDEVVAAFAASPLR